MQLAQSLLVDIEHHVRTGSDAQRVRTLRLVTDLFLHGSNGFSSDQVALFDGVIGRLIGNIEAKALAQLSRELAPVDNAPVNVVRRLSHHDEIRIAMPVLEQSNRLTDQDLAEIASTKSQAHLLAIAGRRQLSPVVTDILVDRGNNAVAQRTAGNKGASFSNRGYVRLVERAEQNEDIAERVASRSDLPEELFQQLVARASDAVLNRLVNHADPATRKRMQEILPIASGEVTKLAEEALDAANRSIADLASLTGLPVELVRRIVNERNHDATLILCKAAQMGWPATRTFLASTGFAASGDEAELRADRANFLQISADTAQRVVRFIKARGALAEGDLDRMLREQAGMARPVGLPPVRPR